MQEYETYIRLWREVIVRLLLDLMDVDIKEDMYGKYKATQYLKLYQRDFSVVCELAGVNYQKIMENIERLIEKENEMKQVRNKQNFKCLFYKLVSSCEDL